MKKVLILTTIASAALLGGCTQTHPTINNQSTGSMELSAEHCAMMPDMPGCEAYQNTTTSGESNTGTTSDNLPPVSHTMNHADMVTSDFDFVYLMIPHHQEAVDTAKTINSFTQNTELKTLTHNIIDGQAKEITMMKGWLATSYSGVKYEGMGYMPMMRDSSTINDTKMKEKIWIEDMIGHHQGAVDMANKVLSLMKQQDLLIRLSADGMKQREALKAFAQAVIDAQSKEITQMKTMLQSY